MITVSSYWIYVVNHFSGITLWCLPLTTASLQKTLYVVSWCPAPIARSRGPLRINLAEWALPRGLTRADLFRPLYLQVCDSITPYTGHCWCVVLHRYPIHPNWARTARYSPRVPRYSLLICLSTAIKFSAPWDRLWNCCSSQKSNK